ncbi:MAG: hypothetical protein AAFN12_09130 [Cyanobacteria bacterium J06560_2]
MQSNFSSGASDALEAEFQQIIRRQHRNSSDFSQNALKRWLVQAGRSVVAFLTGQQTLSIRSKVLSDGSTQWTVYDPFTQSRHVFGSRQAVCVWLEERYYR